jgi:hypothetical protein
MLALRAGGTVVRLRVFDCARRRLCPALRECDVVGGCPAAVKEASSAGAWLRPVIKRTARSTAVVIDPGSLARFVAQFE